MQSSNSFQKEIKRLFSLNFLRKGQIHKRSTLVIIRWLLSEIHFLNQNVGRKRHRVAAWFRVSIWYKEEGILVWIRVILGASFSADSSNPKGNIAISYILCVWHRGLPFINLQIYFLNLYVYISRLFFFNVS